MSTNDNDNGRPDDGGRRHMFDNQANVRRVLYGLYAAAGLSFLLDWVIARKVYHSWEQIPAFYALYGFAACVVLVLAATQLRKVLMRSEDYYDEPGDE